VDDIHPRSRQAFSQVHEDYEHGRPVYAEAAVEWAIATFSIPRGRMLDLGAGTGKLTRLIVPRAAQVVAVEPVAAMRGVLAREVPEAIALDGRAEAIPLDERSVDAVFAGQAFHWFAPAPTLDEVARVLRPGGALVLLWNHWRLGESAWVDELAAAIGEKRRKVSDAAPEWRPVLAADERFEPVRDTGADHDEVTDAEGVLALVRSHSPVAVLPEDERTALLERIAVLVEGTPPPLLLPYRTEAYGTRLRSGAD
jgi:SAM-dependent methyltransferase